MNAPVMLNKERDRRMELARNKQTIKEESIRKRDKFEGLLLKKMLKYYIESLKYNYSNSVIVHKGELNSPIFNISVKFDNILNCLDLELLGFMYTDDCGYNDGYTSKEKLRWDLCEKFISEVKSNISIFDDSFKYYGLDIDFNKDEYGTELTGITVILKLKADLN